MKRNLLFFLALFFFASQSFSQTGREVTGLVKDTAGVAVFGATVKLVPANKPSDTLMIRTNINGMYIFNAVPASQFTLNITSLGFEPATVNSDNPAGTGRITVPTITLKAGASVLEVVTITGTPPVNIKEDTIEYTASDFKLREDAVVEDLVKRVDGAEVGKDGSVTQNGKSVTKVRIDGKDYFGGDVATALKNIPVNAVDKIQFIDDYGDQAAFTGVRDGEAETVLNITTRPGRNTGVIANATAAGGNEGTLNKDLYQFQLFGSQFKGERNIGIVANLNNNNAPISGGNFGGRNGAGGGNVGGGGGNTGGGNTGFGGGNTGLTTASQLALNYSNRLSPKLQLTAAYNYNGNDRNTLTLSRSEAAIGQNGEKAFETGNNDVTRVANSHGFTTRMIYNINPKNLLNFNGGFSFSNTDQRSTNSTFQTGLFKQDQTNAGNTVSSAPSYNADITYSHVFTKPGRNTSINVNLRNSDSNSDVENLNNTLYYDPVTAAIVKDSLFRTLVTNSNLSFSGSARLIFQEPIGIRSRLQFSYNAGLTARDNEKLTNVYNSAGIPVLNNSLSNVYNSEFLSQTVALNYYYQGQNNQLQVGIQGFPTSLRGSSQTLSSDVHRSFFTLAPVFRYTYRYSRTRTLQANYMGRPQEPDFAQLQPVRDESNPQRPVVGNPNLNVAFSHNVNITYNTSNPLKRTSFLLRLNGGAVQNQIVSNSVLVPDVFGAVKRETRYLNTNGSYNYGLNYSTQKSFKDRQYIVSLRGNASFRNTVGYNNDLKNTSQTLSLTQGLTLQVNPGTWMELNPSMYYTYSQNTYSLETQVDRTIQTYTGDVTASFFFLKTRSLIFRFNANKQINKGYQSNLTTNPFIVNASVEQQFLKNRMATIKLQAFDLLNESTNLNFNATSNGFSETQTNRLTQYFMLSLTMRINRFAGGVGGGSQTQQVPGMNQRGQGAGGFGGGQGGNFGGGQGGNFGGGQGGF